MGKGRSKGGAGGGGSGGGAGGGGGGIAAPTLKKGQSETDQRRIRAAQDAMGPGAQADPRGPGKKKASKRKETKLPPLSKADRQAVKAAQSAKRPTAQQKALRQAAEVRAANKRINARNRRNRAK